MATQENSIKHYRPSSPVIRYAGYTFNYFTRASEHCMVISMPLMPRDSTDRLLDEVFKAIEPHTCEGVEIAYAHLESGEEDILVSDGQVYRQIELELPTLPGYINDLIANKAFDIWEETRSWRGANDVPSSHDTRTLYLDSTGNEYPTILVESESDTDLEITEGTPLKKGLLKDDIHSAEWAAWATVGELEAIPAHTPKLADNLRIPVRVVGESVANEVDLADMIIQA